MNDSEPKDICCVCNAVGEYGSMQAVNEIDFELLCKGCKKKRCISCNFLRSKEKFGDPRYFCRHRGTIEEPKRKVCDHWEVRGKRSNKTTVKDYTTYLIGKQQEFTYKRMIIH